MIKYLVHTLTIDNTFSMDISEIEFNKLKKTKEILSEVLSKENIYNIVLMNYYEFEKELYEISLKDEVFGEHDYDSFNMNILKIEQRVLNLFSSITSYFDSFKDDNKVENKHSKFIRNEMKTLENFIKSEVNNNKSYNIMIFLRNHIQHNGLLIGSISKGGKNVSEALRESTIGFSINKNNIKAKFYDKEDYENFPDELNLKSYIREYVDFLSNVHHKFRSTLNDITNNSRKNIDELFEKCSPHTYLEIIKIENDDVLDEVSLLLNWDDVRINFVKNNRVPTFFKRHSINTK